MVEKGIVHGRFQVMHLGYMEYLLAAKMRCKNLLIGIGNPDVTHMQFNRYQPGSMQAKYNPFTYYEKMQMIRAALSDFGIPLTDVEFAPFPLDTPKLLPYYVPEDGVFYMTIFDEWGMEKKELLEEKMGYRVELLRTGRAEDKKITGTMVLESIANNDNWEQLVPRSVAQYMIENGLDRRVSRIWREAKLQGDAAGDVEYDPLDDIIINRLDEDPEPMPYSGDPF